MKRQDFYFDLPLELIAQVPLPKRSDSRLLVYNRQTKAHSHCYFPDMLSFLQAGDLLVFNKSKVIPARLFGKKETGGKIELLVERIIDASTCWAHIKNSQNLRIGAKIILSNHFELKILEKSDNLFLCKANQAVAQILNEIGHIPLPPYIKRTDSKEDIARYQTIYAEKEGSVAAPTAGLHFDEALFANLQKQGLNVAFTTLHVGAGTFQPVRVEDLKDHQMHREQMFVDEQLCEQVNQTKAAGKRVIAVGTTSLRCLETAAKEGVLKPFQGETDIFIYPSYKFQICDALLTNFHLPESTLLMLVAAFIGYEEVMSIYQEAIKQQYRFFSYGDACLFI